MQAIITDYASRAAEIRLIRDQVFILEQQVPREEEFDDRDPVCPHAVVYELDVAVATGRIGWHRLSFRFGGDEDLERFEREIRQLVGDRVSRDLLRLDVSGTLSLAGHRRYDQLIEDLSSRLLRLRLKGSCGQAPQADELARLTERPGDPLIARVAAQLQQRLAGGAAGNDEEQAAMLRAALCELYRLATSG